MIFAGGDKIFFPRFGPNLLRYMFYDLLDMSFVRLMYLYCTSCCNFSHQSTLASSMVVVKVFVFLGGRGVGSKGSLL